MMVHNLTEAVDKCLFLKVVFVLAKVYIGGWSVSVIRSWEVFVFWRFELYNWWSAGAEIVCFSEGLLLEVLL